MSYNIAIDGPAGAGKSTIVNLVSRFYNVNSGRVLIDDVEEVNEKASKKRAEAIARISNTPARDVAEQYGSVCDTIAEGKDRFRKRCTEWTDYEDIRR